MITAAAIYCLAVGLLMLGWWAVEVRGGVIHRPDRKPVEIGLHLTAETLTAVWLVTAGGALLARGAGVATFAAAGLGMLLYSVIQSVPPGTSSKVECHRWLGIGPPVARSVHRRLAS